MHAPEGRRFIGCASHGRLCTYSRLLLQPCHCPAPCLLCNKDFDCIQYISGQLDVIPWLPGCCELACCAGDCQAGLLLLTTILAAMRAHCWAQQHKLCLDSTWLVVHSIRCHAWLPERVLGCITTLAALEAASLMTVRLVRSIHHQTNGTPSFEGR